MSASPLGSASHSCLLFDFLGKRHLGLPNRFRIDKNSRLPLAHLCMVFLLIVFYGVYSLGIRFTARRSVWSFLLHCFGFVVPGERTPTPGPVRLPGSEGRVFRPDFKASHFLIGFQQCFAFARWQEKRLGSSEPKNLRADL